MNPSDELLLTTIDHVGHAYALIHDLTKKSLEGSGMGVAEAQALSVLQSVGTPLSQSEWARLNAFSRQRAHVIAHRLVEMGLVTLSKQGRTSTVTLTEQGRLQINAKHEVLLQALTERIQDAVSPQDIEVLHRLLGQLIAALSSPSPTP